jgi:Mitochondrial carrier protein
MSQNADKNRPKNMFVANSIVAVGTAVANYVSDLMCYPLDTINTWIKLSSPRDSIRQIVRDHIKRDGYRVLFKGVNTQFILTFVPTYIYFFCYETANRYSRVLLEHLQMEKYIGAIPSVTSGLSQSISLLILVPMDALKTRMQTSSPFYKYNSVLHGLSDIIQREGYIRLFQASPVYIFHAIVFNMILFQAYETLRRGMMSRRKCSNNDLTMLDSLINTGLATMFAMSITNPLDLLIIRYQVTDSSKKKLSFSSIVKDVVKADGIKGLNRGVFFRTFYGSLSACLYLPFYEELRKRYGYDFSEPLN